MINDFLNNPEWKLKFICVGWAFIGCLNLSQGVYGLMQGIDGDIITVVVALATIALSFGLYRRNYIVRVLAVIYSILGFLFMTVVLFTAYSGYIIFQIYASLLLCFYAFSIFQLGFNKDVKRLFSDKSLKAGQ